MKQVTDPKLIAQLEGTGGMQPVTDPALISQLEGNSVSPTQTMNPLMRLASDTDMVDNQYQNKPLIQANNYSALANFGLGALGATRNFLQDVANIPPELAPSLFPKGQLPQVPQGQGFAYGAGQFAGNLAPFLAGGEILDAARGAAEGVPMIGKLASALGGDGIAGVARRAVGTGAYGAITNPNNPLMGTLEGIGGSVMADALPGAANFIGKGIASVRPQQQLNQILDSLSNGGQSLEDSGKSLAAELKQSLQNKYDYASSNFYNPVLSQVGNSKIYPDIKGAFGGEFGTVKVPQGQYQNLPNSITGLFSSNVNKLDKSFSDNPTFSNAHDLQKQLGQEIGALQYTDRINPSEANSNKLQAYVTARNALKNDMGNFLNQVNPDLNNLWQQGTNYYKNEVVPYFSVQNIKDMATGDETNPVNSSIARAFKNPDQDIEKIVNDLPDQSTNRILYSILGKNSSIKSPENFVNSINKLDQDGLASYLSPDLRNQVEKLGSSINRRTNINRLVGLGLGATLGHSIGALPGTAEMIGGAAGALFGPQLASKIGSIPSFNNLSNIASPLYQQLSKALLANMIPGGQ